MLSHGFTFSLINNYSEIRLPRVDCRDLSAKDIVAYGASILFLPEDRAFLSEKFFSERKAHDSFLTQQISTLEKFFEMPEKISYRKEETTAKIFIRDLASKIKKNVAQIDDYPKLGDDTKEAIKNAAFSYLDCREALVILHSPLIFSFLRRKNLLMLGEEDLSVFEDLLQDVGTGLVDAIDRFEPELKVQFSPYAEFHLLSGMNRWQASRNMFQLSPFTQETVFKIIQEKERQISETGSYDISEIANNLGKGEDTVRLCIQSTEKPVLLSELNSCEEEYIKTIEDRCRMPLAEIIHKETEAGKRHLIDVDLPVLMQCLSDRERFVITEHFGLNPEKKEKTYDEIRVTMFPGRILSRQYIEQVLRHAVTKLLRKANCNDELRNRVSNLLFDGRQIPNVKKLDKIPPKKRKSKSSAKKKES